MQAVQSYQKFSILCLCSLSLTVSVRTQLSGRNWCCSSPDEAEEKNKFYVTQVLVSGILRVTEGRRRRARRQPGVRPGKNSRPLGLRKHRVALQRNASPEVAARRGLKQHKVMTGDRITDTSTIPGVC